jgi:eukaryotic-like serine/threonine-protein kinase
MQLGQIFQSRYRMAREVGRGSFGIVYAADDLQTNQPVAIKVLLPWTRDVESLRHRLRREAKLTRLLRSPHAIRFHDLDETPDGDLYIVMELLHGEELNVLLKREGRLQPERARDIARQILDAIQESHALGVIHRDLKPHNIFICRTDTERDHVKVLDFGIAKVTGTEDGSGLTETTRLTSPGGVVGTPAYMSPEQCRGESLSAASDFYSLGVVLYEMVAGHVPFHDSNPVQVLVMHNAQPVPPLPSTVAGTPLGHAILRALEKDPHARFATAAEFLSFLENRPVASPSVAIVAQPISKAGPQLPAEVVNFPAASHGRPPRGVGSILTGVLRRYLIALVILILLGLLALSQYL